MFVKYPSIEQFRQMVREITEHCQYVGKDENDKAIYDLAKPLPVLKFRQTVKIHGTNGAVSLTRDGKLEVQSRNRLLSEQSDNNGFWKWVNELERKQVFINLLLLAIQELGAKQSVVFGEFAGENIQKRVGVSQLPKQFYIFEFAVIYDDDTIEYILPDPMGTEMFSCPALGIHSVTAFGFDTIDIDIANPDEVVNELNRRALAVEERCPVAYAQGVDGMGEGIVLSAQYNNRIYRTKIKGEKHSASKVKLLANVNEVEMADIKEFVESVVTENRLEQGIQYLQEMNIPVVIKSMGDFIKWVVSDVRKEEQDIINTKAYKGKLLNQLISNKARKFFASKVGV